MPGGCCTRPLGHTSQGVVGSLLDGGEGDEQRPSFGLGLLLCRGGRLRGLLLGAKAKERGRAAGGRAAAPVTW